MSSDYFDSGTTEGNLEIGFVQGLGFALAYIAVWAIAYKYFGVRHP